MNLNFTVYGRPAAQGSKRAFVNKRTGKVALVEVSDKVRPWRQDVKQAAIEQTNGAILDGPVAVELHFFFMRPKSAKKSVVAPCNRGSGDIDKLCRSTLDALTEAGVWHDDAQVCDLRATKSFWWREGARIIIVRM